MQYFTVRRRVFVMPMDMRRTQEIPADVLAALRAECRALSEHERPTVRRLDLVVDEAAQ